MLFWNSHVKYVLETQLSFSCANVSCYEIALSLQTDNAPYLFIWPIVLSEKFACNIEGLKI